MSTIVTLGGVDTPKGEVYPKVASFGCGEATLLHSYPPVYKRCWFEGREHTMKSTDDNI